MKLRITGLIAVGSGLLFASTAIPLTIQASPTTTTRMGVHGGQTVRAGSRPMWYLHDGKTVEFDPPGTTQAVSATCGWACGSFAIGNNEAGTIVGYYTDKDVVPHGFIRFGDGRFRSFDAPGAGLGPGLYEGTVPFAIDAAGSIVGQYQDANFIFHGFVRQPDGSFSTFSVPGAGTQPGQGTIAWDLNRGETAGYYVDANNVQHGFVRSPDHKITTFDLPGSVHTHPCQVGCLSDAGLVGGFIRKDNVVHGFLREPNGKLREFDAPGAGRSAYQGTVFYGINSQGTISGFLIDANNLVHGFLRYRNGSYVIGEVPGTGTGPYQGTYTLTINAFGAATGYFIDANNVAHGFERFKNGALARFDAPDAAPANGGTVPSANNIWGAVVGSFIDKTGLNHSFLWTP